MRSTILLDPDLEGSGYTVTVPALAGCLREGAAIDEALADAREAIECHVECLLASGDDAPREAPMLIPLVAEVEIDVPTPALAS